MQKPTPARPWPQAGPRYPEAGRRKARTPPTPAAAAPPETAPALRGGRHRAVSPFLGQVTREPAVAPLPVPFYGPWGPAWVPHPAGRALAYASGGRRKRFVWRGEETSSRPRRPAQAAAQGLGRAPVASRARGGPASTTAAPAAPAARELWADRRARLPGSAPAPGASQATRKPGRGRRRWAKARRGYPGALSGQVGAR